MNEMKQKLIVVVMFLLVGLGTTFAQPGFLNGKIIDKKTGEELVGAAIVVDGTAIGSITDFNGEYKMPPLEAGTYKIRVQYISYDPQVFEAVVIKGGEETVLNIQLSSATMNLKEVQVNARVNRESENILLLQQRKAVLAHQSIGAQEISRKGISDAEGAVAKVSGVSKQEGEKNVFVRGLGDRYNATTLNGFPIPSEDPEYKNISLDFFSSDLIKVIGVDKVFGAQSAGDVAGAQINISSKELVGDGDLKLSISGKANTQSISEQGFMVADGVNNFGLGVNTKSPSSSTSEVSYSFGNSLDAESQDLQVGKGLGISGGKSFDFNNNKLRFYFVGGLSQDFNFYDGTTRKTTTSGIISSEFNTKKYNREYSHIGMANVNLQLVKTNLAYNGLLIHTTEQTVRDDWGYDSDKFQSTDDYDNKGLKIRQQVYLNTLLVNQLLVNHKFNNRIMADAGVAYNSVVGNEPDRRVNNLYVSDEVDDDYYLTCLKGSGNQHRYFGKLEESDLNGNLKLTYKITDDEDNISDVELGYKGRFLSDEYNSNSWDNSYYNSNSIKMNELSLDDLFNNENFLAGDFKNEEYSISQYKVDKKIHSVYAIGNYQFGQDLFLNIGLRADKVDVEINYDVNDGAKEGSNSIDELYILPSLNVKYNVNDKHALRLGASKTYTLPQSKEIAPLLYEGAQWSTQGNQYVVPSTDYNVDLKWELYLTGGELISATAFGKIIQDPISRVEISSAGGFLSYANIAENATVYGLEFEARKNVFSTVNDASGNSNKLAAGVNLSYIYTHADLYESAEGVALNFTYSESELEGAAPIIANADLTYNFRNEKKEFVASIVGNYISERIYSVGVGSYEDVMNSSVFTVDFVSSYKVNKHVGISLKAKNLTDPKYNLTRKASTGSSDVVLSEYQKGISLSLGLSYKF
jgi:outer membrane receptor protein involved in Fe transport